MKTVDLERELADALAAHDSQFVMGDAPLTRRLNDRIGAAREVAHQHLGLDPERVCSNSELLQLLRQRIEKETQA
jgi:hypothetical protein